MRKRKISNKYVTKGLLTELHIEGSVHGNKIVLLDTEDVAEIKKRYWTINKYTKAKKYYYYIVSTTGASVLLHRYIVKANNGRETTVDHINNDTLDNRKENLQICTQKENLRKSQLKSTNKSGVTGVCWYKKTNKWMAHIKLNYKHITIGYFDTIEQALEARINFEKEHYKNFVPDRGNQTIHKEVI